MPRFVQHFIRGPFFSRSLVLIVCLSLASCSEKPQPTVEVPEADEQEQETQVSRIKAYVAEHQAESLALIQQAKQALGKGDHDRALKLLRESLTVYPRNTEAYSLIGEIYFQLKDYRQVLRMLEEAGPNTNAFVPLFYYFFKKEWGYPSAPGGLVSVARFKDNKDAAVSFMFSDGSRTVYTNALPLFDNYGYKATISLLPAQISDEKATSTEEFPRGSWAEWRDAAQRGFELSNHTMSHSHPNALHGKELDYEINHALEVIQEKTGFRPRSFIFPDYAVDQHSLEKVYERHAAVMDPVLLSQIDERVFVPYFGGRSFHANVCTAVLDFSIKNKMWLIPMCHAVKNKESLSMHRPLFAASLEKHLQDIKEREANVWVDTFLNVYRYVFERENSTVKILEENKRSVVFTISNDLSEDVFEMPLTMNIDVSPARPKTAQASRKSEGGVLPVKIAGSRLSVDVIPGAEEVTVEWQ